MEMETTGRFSEIKSEILRRAKEAKACEPQYKRAYAAVDIAALMQVVKDNFAWCCRNRVLAADIFELYGAEFAAYDIFCNVNVERGYLLAYDSSTVEAYGSSTVEAYGSSTVRAYGSSTVRAYGSSTVEAYDSSTVRAYGSSTVRAYDSSTVEAYDSSTVEAYGSSYIASWGTMECKLSGNAIHRVMSTGEIRYASDALRFVKVESAEASE